jgi:hypothetical protein
MQLAAAEACVRILLIKPAPLPMLTRWMRGFQSFAAPQTQTPLGAVVAFGAAAQVHHDELSGGLQIQAPDPTAPPGWRADAGDFLLHMQRGLSLAHGGRLQCPVEFYLEGSIREVTFRRGSSQAPELPVQPHLSLEPFLKALAARYFGKGPLPDILWTALGWCHADTTIDDLRFLTGMIALEAIATACLPAKSKSFATNIQSLFGHFGVATADFGVPVIKAMVALRNEIVHEGEAKSVSDLWANIILVRELVSRILMVEIGYAGHYWCYIGGQHLRQFPSCSP